MTDEEELLENAMPLDETLQEDLIEDSLEEETEEIQEDTSFEEEMTNEEEILEDAMPLDETPQEDLKEEEFLEDDHDDFLDPISDELIEEDSYDEPNMDVPLDLSLEENDFEDRDTFDEQLAEDIEPLEAEEELEDSLEDNEFEEPEEDPYSYEESEIKKPAPTPKEVKIIEGEKYIVKETKSSLFIREKDIKKIDESEDETPDIPYKKIDFYNR